MRQRIEFIDNKYYSAPGYDDQLTNKKFPFRQELGILIRSLGLLRGYYPWIILPMILNILWGSLWLLIPMLDKILIDEIIPDQNWSGFWVLIAIAMFAYLQNQIVTLIKMQLSLFLNGRMGLWLQIQFFRHLQKLPLTLIERKGIGDQMYRLHGDTVGCINLPVAFWGEVVQNLYGLIIFVVFLGAIDMRIMWIMLGLEVFYFTVAQIVGTWNRKVQFFAKQAKSLADARVQEGLAGILTVKTYGRKKAEVAEVVHRVGIQARVEVLHKIVMLVQNGLLRHHGVFPFVKAYLVSYILSWDVIHGQASYGTVVAVVAFIDVAQKPVNKLIDLWNTLRFRMVQVLRVWQIWDTKPNIIETKNPVPVPYIKGDIQVKDVNFDYENGIRVLHNVNFSVEPGSFTAIVGPSGSGKSTMLNLLIRLYDPASGAIYVDGTDIKNFNFKKYQQSIGLVLQETFVSKETLRWNMMLGRNDASDEEMIAALEKCRLKGWFDKLPHGLDSYLNEGSRLSIGEKQRLGISRNLLRKGNLLFLDEPTSSLDLETEQEVMEVIHRIRKEKTTVMVTHRLNTIVEADKIVVMDRGHVVETGTHSSLMAQSGKYYDLYNMFIGTATTGMQSTWKENS